MAKGSSKSGGLSAKQKAFVREYLKDFNGTQAAIRAKYAVNGASVQATRLLADARIQAAIAKGQQKAAERADLSVDDIVRGFREIAECDVTAVVGWNDFGELIISDFDMVPPEVRRCISEIRQTETKDGKKSIAVKFYSKTEALSKLGQHFGMFVQKVEVSAGEETVKTAFQIAREATAAKKKARVGDDDDV